MFCVLGGTEEGLFHLRPVPQLGGQPSCQSPALREAYLQQPYHRVSLQAAHGWRGECACPPPLLCAGCWRGWAWVALNWWGRQQPEDVEGPVDKGRQLRLNWLAEGEGRKATFGDLRSQSIPRC